MGEQKYYDEIHKISGGRPILPHPEIGGMEINPWYLRICLEGAEEAGMLPEFLDTTFIGRMSLRQFLKNKWAPDNIKVGRISKVKNEKVDTSTRVFNALGQN